MDFDKKYAELVETVNLALDGYMTKEACLQQKVYDAMRYSLEAGGKRLRPVIMLAICDMLGGNLDEVLPFACAVEMIHTYSLIHDDLPAMDNDDLRRGKPTNHKVYGEAMAILAGDALLNYAFEVMINWSLTRCEEYEKNLMALKIIARAAGPEGMIGGQTVDIEWQGKTADEKVLKAMYKNKTGALFVASVHAASVLCKAPSEHIKNLLEYSENLGFAFQLQDDILDIVGNIKLMGKSIGSDQANNKSTFVSLYGLDAAREMLDNATKKSLSALDAFGQNADFLRELTGRLGKRET